MKHNDLQNGHFGGHSSNVFEACVLSTHGEESWKNILRHDTKMALVRGDGASPDGGLKGVFVSEVEADVLGLDEVDYSEPVTPAVHRVLG